MDLLTAPLLLVGGLLLPLMPPARPAMAFPASLPSTWAETSPGLGPRLSLAPVGQGALPAPLPMPAGAASKAPPATASPDPATPAGVGTPAATTNTPTDPAQQAPATSAASTSSGDTTSSWPSLQELLTLPSWMNLTLTVTAAPIANPIGGLTSSAAWMQQSELNLAVGSGLALDASRWRQELDHWQAKVRLDYYNGQPNFSSKIGSLFAPQTIAFSPGLYLSGLSLQRSSRDQSLKISAGYQSLDQDFLVAPSYLSYLYSGFNDTLNLTLPGLPITPFAAPSLVLHWQTPGWGTWSVGAYWLDQETELAGLLGAPSGLTDDLRGSLQIVQWDLPLWRHDTALAAAIPLAGGVTVPRQLPAPLLQLGAFRSDASFVASSDSPTGLSPLVNHVIYSSLTLPARLPLGLDNRLWGTVQWGLNPSQNISPLFLAGGWQCQGLFRDRPLDVLSLGIGRTAFSPQLLPQLSWAGAVELNYSFHINDRLSLQPVLQWLLRPSGEGSVPAILTTALQLNLSF